MKILNCITDEKFIDFVIEICEHTKGEHLYNHVIFSEVKTLIYIKKKQYVQFVTPDNFINHIKENNYDAIIIHSLKAIPFLLLCEIPKEIKVAWKAWGFDIYSFPHPKIPFVKIKGLYHAKTKKAIKLDIKTYLQYEHAYLYTLLHYKRIKLCIKRIDFFSGVFSEEYILMKRHAFFHATEFTFNYGRIDKTISLDNINASFVNQNNILVGNSGDPTNNHIDIFTILHERNIKNIPIYVPLSYGGSKKYIDQVIQIGYQFFGKQFHPIINFLPPQEYFKIVMNCSNIIMGHERQQAVGNIIQSLWQGSKVFLFDSSITYQHYKSQKIKIFSINQDLEPSQTTSYLSKEDIINNRMKLIESNSAQANVQCLYNFYNLLLK